MPHYQMYIDGSFTDSSSGATFETENPFTGKVWATVARGNADDVDRAVRAAHCAFASGEWRALTPSHRGALLGRLGDLITEHSVALAETEVRDNGKLFAEMSAQAAYMAQ